MADLSHCIVLRYRETAVDGRYTAVDGVQMLA